MRLYDSAGDEAICCNLELAMTAKSGPCAAKSGPCADFGLNFVSSGE